MMRARARSLAEMRRGCKQSSEFRLSWFYRENGLGRSARMIRDDETGKGRFGEIAGMHGGCRLWYF
jgi:hypothetical protein